MNKAKQVRASLLRALTQAADPVFEQHGFKRRRGSKVYARRPSSEAQQQIDIGFYAKPLGRSTAFAYVDPVAVVSFKAVERAVAVIVASDSKLGTSFHLQHGSNKPLPTVGFKAAHLVLDRSSPWYVDTEADMPAVVQEMVEALHNGLIPWLDQMTAISDITRLMDEGERYKIATSPAVLADVAVAFLLLGERENAREALMLFDPRSGDRLVEAMASAMEGLPSP